MDQPAPPALSGRFTLSSPEGTDRRRSTDAHRFTVLIPGELTAEQRDVVTTILDDHRPAHTLGEVCELGAGLRIGTQARVGLTTYVGPACRPALTILGTSTVGVDSMVGLPDVDTRIGVTTRVGAVLVG